MANFDPFNLDNTVYDESQIVYTSPGGESWLLAGTGHGVGDADQRVTLLKGGYTGGDANPDITYNDSPTGHGRWDTGEYTLPALEGELSVLINDTPATAGRTWRRWRASWSEYKDGTLRVIDRSGLNFWTTARLKPGGRGDVNQDPALLRVIPDAVSWVGNLGHWWGTTRTFDAGQHVITAGGNMPPSTALRWTGAASSVTFPTGVTVTLPSVTPGSYLIDLNRGMSGHVTNADTGATEHAVWAALRGRMLGITLTPGETTTWTLTGGLTLEMTARYTSPWR